MKTSRKVVNPSNRKRPAAALRAVQPSLDPMPRAVPFPGGMAGAHAVQVERLPFWEVRQILADDFTIIGPPRRTEREAIEAWNAKAKAQP